MTWETVVVILGTGAGALLLLAAASRLLARIYASASGADEIRHARTTDGWLIALHHYVPRRAADGREPVLMCHGMISNRASLDLDPKISLARHLRDEGFDVWLMEMRARGASRRDPGGSPRRWWPRLGFDWSVDEFVREDLPAAVREVLRLTGARRLHWVGHSMGGMILCAHAVSGETAWFRSAVLIDSPVHFAPLKRATWPARLYALLVPVVPIIVFKPLFTLLYWIVPDHLLKRIIALDRATLLKVMHNGLVDVGSSRVMLHIAQVIADGRFRSLDRRVDYEEGPKRIGFPLMVLRAPAGRTPEACVRWSHDVSPSKDRLFVRCGRAEGFQIDHNHFTLMIGRSAPAEIFPIIAGFLRERSSA